LRGVLRYSLIDVPLVGLQVVVPVATLTEANRLMPGVPVIGKRSKRENILSQID